MEQGYEESNVSELEREVSSAPIDNRSTFRKITDVYFKPKSFEKSGKLYEALGVKYVQKAIMGTAGRAFRAMGIDDDAGTYFIGKKRDLKSLKTYENWTRAYELIHAPQILWNIDSLTKAISEEDYGSATVSGVALLINTGCSMLQRYNRARVDKVIERAEKRKQ